MARPSPLTYLPILHHALSVEIGIAFRVSGVPRRYFANTLYDCIKQANEPALSGLILFQPAVPYDDEIWVCNKQVELEP